MTNFDGIKFIHQDKTAYGEGKKVTSTMLENDAENTEYLLAMHSKNTPYCNTRQIIDKPVTPEATNTISNFLYDNTEKTYQRTIYQETLTDGTIIPTQKGYITGTESTIAEFRTKVYEKPSGTHWKSIKFNTVEKNETLLQKYLIEDTTFGGEYKVYTVKDADKYPTINNLITMIKNFFKDNHSDETINLPQKIQDYNFDDGVKTAKASDVSDALTYITEHHEKEFAEYCFESNVLVGTSATYFYGFSSGVPLAKCKSKDTRVVFKDAYGTSYNCGLNYQAKQSDISDYFLVLTNSNIKTSSFGADDSGVGGSVNIYYYMMYLEDFDTLDFSTKVHHEKFSSSIMLDYKPLTETIQVYVDNVRVMRDIDYDVNDNLITFNASIPSTSSYVTVYYQIDYEFMNITDKDCSDDNRLNSQNDLDNFRVLFKFKPTTSSDVGYILAGELIYE